MLKPIAKRVAAAGLFAGLLLAGAAGAQAQRYVVTDLGPPGSPFSQATWLNSKELVTGFYITSSGTSHAALFFHGEMTDLGQAGLGGPNSSAAGINASGQVIGEGETSAEDPNNENFCGYGTGLQCLAFLWERGVITPLPTLGGTNSGPGTINHGGEIAGYAETNSADSACPTAPAINGTGPQTLDLEAVIWGPGPGEIRELYPLPGDTVGMAFGNNDVGQAVGTTGTCANLYPPGFAAGPHAVLWDADGSVHDIGNLGGTSNPAVLAVGNVAFAINNRAQVTGISAVPGSLTAHPFLWTEATGMQDLGLLPGDFIGAGLDLNDEGEVVGANLSAPGAMGGTPRAVLWPHGPGTGVDLNALIPSGSPLYLLTAFSINDAGDIAGFALVTSGPDAGAIHGFLAEPCAPNSAATACQGAVAGRSRQTAPRPSPLLNDRARALLLRWEQAGHHLW